MPKYHPDSFNDLGDIPENVYSAELKPIVVSFFFLMEMVTMPG